MEKRRYDLCLCDSDPAYVERLMSYIRRKPNFLFTVLGFTRPEELLTFLENEAADLVIIGEKYWTGFSAEEQASMRGHCGCLIRLTDRRQASGEIRSVCRYQSAERLLQEVVKHFEENLPEENGSADRTRIDAFWSPDGACGQTTCALLLGHRLAENCGRSVLYMNLEALAGSIMTGQSTPDGGRGLRDVIRTVREKSTYGADVLTNNPGHSLSDLLYYRRNKGRGTLIQSLTASDGALSVLMPAVNPEDIWSLSGEDLTKVLTEIRDRGIYDSVILDLGRDRDPEPVFSVCRNVFLPERSSEGREAFCSGKPFGEFSEEGMWLSGRMDHFLKYVEQRTGEIPGNWQRIRPPYIPELAGCLPGRRCTELEEWLEKVWLSCS